MINESEIYENGSKLVDIFKSGFDNTYRSSFAYF